VQAAVVKNEAAGEGNWGERYGLMRDGEVLGRIADAAQVPDQDGLTWRSAVVVTVGSHRGSSVKSYVQFVQDLDWLASERDISEAAIVGLLRRLSTLPPR
jgi:hypothetical protein